MRIADFKGGFKIALGKCDGNLFVKRRSVFYWLAGIVIVAMVIVGLYSFKSTSCMVAPKRLRQRRRLGGRQCSRSRGRASVSRTSPVPVVARSTPGRRRCLRRRVPHRLPTRAGQTPAGNRILLTAKAAGPHRPAASPRLAAASAAATGDPPVVVPSTCPFAGPKT